MEDMYKPGTIITYNGDIKFTRTPLFEPPKLIIGCDLAAEGTSDYSVPYLYKHQ
jgi:hypothetical protein